MANLVTNTEVRLEAGVGTDIVSDDDITSIIKITQSKVKELLDIEFTPTKKIETITGYYKEKIMVDEYFPLTVYKVLNGSTEMDLDNIYVHTEEGFLEIYGDSVAGGGGYPYAGQRFSGSDLDVKVKYLYGVVQKDNTITTDTAEAITAGSSVNFEVLDSSDFTVNDYVIIEDMNRKKEVFKITVIPDTTHITAEILVNSYETGAIVTKVKTHELLKQLVLFESAIVVGTNATGSSYNFATSWAQEGESASFGVPYVHFQKTVADNTKRRDEILGRVRKLLGTIV